MKSVKQWIVAVIAIITTSVAHAQNHTHHAKHGMVLYGENEIFASHIISVVPHNYQVILRVNLPAEAEKLIRGSQTGFRDDLIVLVLDRMLLPTIQTKPALNGNIIRENRVTGERTALFSNVSLSPENYEVVFYRELPTDLTGFHQH